MSDFYERDIAHTLREIRNILHEIRETQKYFWEKSQEFEEENNIE